MTTPIDAVADQLAEHGHRPDRFGRRTRLAHSVAEVDAAEALVRAAVVGAHLRARTGLPPICLF